MQACIMKHCIMQACIMKHFIMEHCIVKNCIMEACIMEHAMRGITPRGILRGKDGGHRIKQIINLLYHSIAGLVRQLETCDGDSDSLEAIACRIHWLYGCALRYSVFSLCRWP